MSFRPTQTGDRVLDGIQRDVKGAFAALEDPSRGLLTGEVLSSGADLQLTEQLVVRYTGRGGNKFTLPKAAIRGARRAMAMFLINAGTGTLTVRAAGGELVGGAASFSLSTGTAAIVCSDGSSAWYRMI